MGREELLKVIDECQARIGIADTAIGLGALNDSKFVMRLREGRRCWPETAQRVIQYLKDQEVEAVRLQSICTEDGTWIAHDRRSGLAHSGKTQRAAEASLRKLMDSAAVSP